MLYRVPKRQYMPRSSATWPSLFGRFETGCAGIQNLRDWLEADGNREIVLVWFGEGLPRNSIVSHIVQMRSADVYTEIFTPLTRRRCVVRILIALAVWFVALGVPVVYAENDFFEVCARGSVAEVQAALARGADLALPNGEGLRPLDIAVRHNTVEVVGLLLEAGADPNAKSENAVPPLIHAVERGDDAFLHVLFQSGADPNWADRDGVTALHRAALGTSKDVISALLLAGANPAQGDVNRRTPVHYAAERGNSSEVLEWLLFSAIPEELTLKLVADNAVLRDTPTGRLLKKIQTVYNTYPQGLLDYCRSKKLSLLMLQARYAKSVQEIEQFNWPPTFFEQADILRQTALLYALKFNKNPEIIRYFIEKTPVRPIVNKQGETALMYAAKYVRNPAIVEQILNKFCGRQKGVTETEVRIQEIVAYGAGINKENELEENALAFAAKYNSVDVVKLLLDNGASTNVKSILGKSLLFYAASNPDKAVSEFLVQKGFSIAEMGRGQKTPALEAAWRNPNPEVVRYYMDLAMAEPHSPDLPQRALTLAARDNVSIDSIGALLAYGDESEKEKILTVQRHLSNRQQDLDEFNRRYNPQRYGMIDSTQVSGKPCDFSAMTEQDILAADDEQFLTICNNAEKEILLRATRLRQAAGKLQSATQALHAAMQRFDDFALFQELVALGAAVDQQTNEGKTSFAQAIASSNPKYVRYFLENGASVHAALENRMAALEVFLTGAAQGNTAWNLEVLQMLVDAGADVNALCQGEMSSSGVYTMLNMASNHFRDPAVVQRMVHSGAEVNPQNVSVPPYAQAATAEVLQTLIDAGASIPFDENIPELHSQKAFGVLARSLREGDWDKTRVMLRYCAKIPMDHLETYLLDQVFMNNSSMAMHMLLQLKEQGFDLDAVDKAGDSLLYSLSAPTPSNFQGIAGKLSDLEAIRVMLWVGANAFQFNPEKIDAASLCLWDEDKKMPGMKYKELPEEIKYLMLY